MLFYPIAICVCIWICFCILGRLYVRLVRPRGLTWGMHLFVSEQTLNTVCTHYLQPGEYWTLVWKHGYCACGDPDPIPCCNIPSVWIDWIAYTVFTKWVLPLVFGSPPLRYVHYRMHIEWTSPWPNANNDPAYRITHYTPTYTPFYETRTRT